MKQNDYGGSCPQFSPANFYNGKRKESFVNGRDNLTRPESFVCCPDVKVPELDDSDPAYRVVNINLKECATKLWNNLFGNLSIESASFFETPEIFPTKFQSVCTVPGCNYGGDRKMKKRAMMRSRSETSKYDYRRPSRRQSEVTKVKKMKMALKYCILEKIAQLKICDSFLVELQHVLARYPYTDLYFYWEILRAIQAEVEAHKCKKGSIDVYKYKVKLKQLYMLSYAITRLILQLDFITGGNPLLPFRRAKSWSQALSHLKEDFRDPATGQLTIKPFPRIARSLRGSFQDDANSENGCSCLPLGLFSRAIGLSGPEGESSCLTLKVDNFPDEFTSFDLESLTYLIDNLNCSLQLECSKGSTGRCQIPNCPYPVPVRDERIIKELQLSIHAIEQLLYYLQRLNSFKLKVSSKRNRSRSRKSKLSSVNVGSKSILKNRPDLLAEMRGERGIEVAAYQVQCPPCPQQVFQTNSRRCSPVKEKKSKKTCIENGADQGLNCEMFPQLCVTKVSPIKVKKKRRVTDKKVFDLCFSDQPEVSSTRSRSRRRSPEPEANRSRSGASCCSSCSTTDDVCKKCNKISASFRRRKEKIREAKRKKRRESRKESDSCSDRECDFAFCVKKPCCERKKECKKDACGASSLPNFRRKMKKDDNVLTLCCNRECQSKGNLISSMTKLAKKIDPNPPLFMCDPDNKLAKNYKKEKCIEKLLDCQSNCKMKDCKHKKERILRLVSLLSNTDCSLAPTKRGSNTSCNNDCTDEVCELYEQFLELACDEKCNKQCNEDELKFLEKLKLLACAKGKCPPPCSNITACEVKRKASVGIQACTSSKDSCCNGPSIKRIAGGSNSDRDWAEPSKLTKSCQSESAKRSDSMRSSSSPSPQNCASPSPPPSPSPSPSSSPPPCPEPCLEPCKKASKVAKASQLDCTDSPKPCKNKRAGQDWVEPCTDPSKPCKNKPAGQDWVEPCTDPSKPCKNKRAGQDWVEPCTDSSKPCKNKRAGQDWVEPCTDSSKPCKNKRAGQDWAEPCTDPSKPCKNKRAGQDWAERSSKSRSPSRSRTKDSDWVEQSSKSRSPSRSSKLSTRDNVGASPSQVCRLVNSKSIECLRKKLESKYRSLSKQQGNLKKTREACARRQCFKCRVRKNSKCKRKGRCMRTCKSTEDSHCTLGGPCKSTKKSSKSTAEVIAAIKDPCAGCKSRACRMKCSRRMKTLSEVFSKRKDHCAIILGEVEEPKKKPCRKKRSQSLTCASRSKSAARSAAIKAQKTEVRLKDVSSQLKNTKTQLKKSCTTLKKYDTKLKRCEAEIRRCQSQLNQCDEAKRRLERCTKVLLKKLSQSDSKREDDKKEEKEETDCDSLA